MILRVCRYRFAGLVIINVMALLVMYSLLTGRDNLQKDKSFKKLEYGQSGMGRHKDARTSDEDQYRNSQGFLPDHHVRAYINPVQAILQQNHWNTEFEAELRSVPAERDLNQPIIAFVPKVNVNVWSEDFGNGQVDHVNVDCAKLFKGDPVELIRAEMIQEKNSSSRSYEQSDTSVLRETQNCDLFKHHRGYIQVPLTEEETDFPLAFSMMVYKDIRQVERLLRAIYRPQNYYCIHIDRKAKPRVIKAATSLASCFDNVFIASSLVAVKWGQFGVIEAEMVCLRDLWHIAEERKQGKWKYFINLTGQEFPLKTNWELVRILKTYNGAVDIGATVSRDWDFRRQCYYTFPNDGAPQCIRPKKPPSTHFTFAKGPVHVAISRNFAYFTLYNEKSEELLYWLNTTIIPDESFFPTLFSSPQIGIPGAYKGRDCKTTRPPHPAVRFKKWKWWRPCRGKVLRHICILTLWDLPELQVRPEMFANKFEVDYHWLAYSCLEQLYWNKTWQEIAAIRYGKRLYFDTSAYGELPWVRKHV